MKRFIANKTGFYLTDLLKGYSVGAYYNTFRQHLALDKEAVKEVQLEKFQKLLSHAYQFSPFYRARLNSIGAKPEYFTTIESIKGIPPLTRDDLQNHWKELICSNVSMESLSKGSSSGSTGTPITYLKDKKASSAGQAAGYLCWTIGGWKLGMKGLHIWGNPTTVQNEWKRKSSRFKAWFLNHYKFPAYQLTDPARMRDLVEYIKKSDFDFLDGYTNSLFLLADHMKCNQQVLKRPLKMVLPTAETLQDYQRNTIATVLGPVFDLYGCSEINGIANECAHCGKYHVIDTHVLLELGKIIDEFDNREFIITDLDNYSFPMIRYLNGDAGKSYDLPPDCIIPFSRLNNISGRQSDIIYLPGGGTLSVPSFFGSMLLKQVKGIIKYQIEKDRVDHLLIKFAVNSEFDEQDISIIQNSLNNYLADKILWDISFVSDIPAEKTGKYKLVIDKTKV